MGDPTTPLQSTKRFRPRWFAPVVWMGSVTLTFAGLILMLAWFLSPTPANEPLTYDPMEVAAVVTAREELFDADGPIITQAVDYSEGEAAAWFPKGEAPILSELVAEGKIPPVANRVGREPVVLEGVDGIGKYGGTWLRLATADGDVFIIGNRLSGASLVRWSPMGYPVVPHVAKGWDISDDLSEYTFYLRPGMKWSDGHPFTADDILYWWEQEVKTFGLAAPNWMTVNGKVGEIIKVDDHTLKFVFPEPNSTVLEALAGGATEPMFTPKHYLSQYHPTLGNQELIAKAMAAQGTNSPDALYRYLKAVNNPSHPRLWPWVARTHTTTPPFGFVRNPYYFAVDSEGNQLPYLDRILFDVKAPALVPIAAAAGGATMQERALKFSDYTMLMEGRERGGYELYHWLSADRADWVLYPNSTRQISPNDRDSEIKAQFLADKRLRQALSLAINRQDIIDSLYSGVGEPSQIEPGKDSPFHSPLLGKSFVEFDPDRANALLDELGLTERDGEGMRTFPDGRRMTWYIDFTAFTGEGPVQFIVDDWADVGVRAVQRERARGLFNSQKNAGLNDFMVWIGLNEFYPISDARAFVPLSNESFYAIAHALWHLRGGSERDDGAQAVGVEPAPGSPIRRSLELYQQAIASPPSEHAAIFEQIAAIAAENIWSIGISTAPPILVVVQNGFRNVPRQAVYSYGFQSPANTGIETYFFENPTDTAGTIAQIKQEMTTVTAARNAIDPATLQTAPGGKLAGFIQKLLVGLVVAGLVLVSIRHPFIGRRFFIMIPTLLVVSVVTFTIIQLPPGDYVETRMLELQATGDTTAAAEVEKLREMFYLDRPVWERYVRWMGFNWFLTLKSEDTGLLQGNLGKSMSTQRSVNETVGDRVMLTFWVSLGTILFTWAVALPIGIYSAVRQYSIGDYVLSFIGFIGMCVPNFLLAILLMYWSGRYLGINVTGLFSPEYATATEWSWGKVLDLLAHIWLPIVVIATGGTAGMIRIMRGNLLDELRKPYVTTAMAKGVRPFRLLMKYPVRLALNPFISGVGGLFPQLVSGGAIVAIVLSLPMVGPILLSSLLEENVYLAASMLMVLSLLGIFGTLVSDLLLLWVDPRIRMEGGKK